MGAGKLADIDRHWLTLISRGGKWNVTGPTDPDGWVTVGKMLTPWVAKVPHELVEMREIEDGKSEVRLTDAGKIVVKYI